jgi:hypothetical protein
MERLKQDLD